MGLVGAPAALVVSTGNMSCWVSFGPSCPFGTGSVFGASDPFGLFGPFGPFGTLKVLEVPKTPLLSGAGSMSVFPDDIDGLLVMVLSGSVGIGGVSEDFGEFVAEVPLFRKKQK